MRLCQKKFKRNKINVFPFVKIILCDNREFFLRKFFNEPGKTGRFDLILTFHFKKMPAVFIFCGKINLAAFCITNIGNFIETAAEFIKNRLFVNQA